MSEIELIIFSYKLLPPLVIPYLLLKVGTSFLSLRLETSVIIFQQPRFSVLWMVPLQCVFYHYLALFFISHLHISSFWTVEISFYQLLQPTFHAIRHTDIRVIPQVINLNKLLFYLKSYVAHLCPEGKRYNEYTCPSFKVHHNHFQSTFQNIFHESFLQNVPIFQLSWPSGYSQKILRTSSLIRMPFSSHPNRIHF